MAFHIKDHATDQALRRLARIKGKSLTDTVREALDHEYEREHRRIPLIERLRPIQDQFAAAAKPGGAPADKAFFDALSGES